jgi:hypothetical protein
MLATKLKGQITRDRRLVVRIPRDMETGTVEVILLHLSSQSTKRRTRRGTTHPAFGIWAKRSDINDAASFAAELRQRVEMRADGNA